ncbi:MAG: hypothetical protein LQ343_000089 [Gyalolechia ehrenbergii]|nr:MAG: hypothetical protein LQ343_000089 [Gyalolechia ehrenbergii]
MANTILPPAPHSLLPPLLACLPTAFASTRPPPALLPLLSPILRQRVQLLSHSASSPSDSWLARLSWDSTRAEQLVSIVEGEAFELHPVSNEIEFDDVQTLGYRRLDQETLHSRVDIRDLGLTIIYLWCVGDTAGGGDGWRVAEVLPLDNREEESSTWSKTIEEANEACQQKNASSTTQKATPNCIPTSVANGIHPDSASNEQANDDDDDYWAQYDNAPSSTPGPPPPQPPAPTSRTTKHDRTASEGEYFSRYADIQPEMDNDDPSTDRHTIGESSLDGHIMTPTSRPNPVSQPPPLPQRLPDNETETEPPLLSPTATEHPYPPQTSSSDMGSSSTVVDKLEGSATIQSQTELAVKQHIASTMKSLYRLARGTGMGVGEFEGTIGRELEVLGIEEGMEGG